MRRQFLCASLLSILIYTLSNGLKYQPSSCKWSGYVDKLCLDLWAERGLAEALTSLWSVLHVDVQKGFVDEFPNETLHPECKNCFVIPQACRPFKIFFELSLFLSVTSPCQRQVLLHLCSRASVPLDKSWNLQQTLIKVTLMHMFSLKSPPFAYQVISPVSLYPLKKPAVSESIRQGTNIKKRI